MKITIEIAPKEIIELASKRNSLDSQKYADIISGKIEQMFCEINKCY